MKLTREEAIANHRKMWNWIADETEKRRYCVSKDAYFYAMWIKSKSRPYNDCYCCEYTRVCIDYGCECLMCPLEWPGRFGTCQDRYKECDGEGIFMKWYYVARFDCGWQTAAKLARQIAELPEREIEDAENA